MKIKKNLFSSTYSITDLDRCDLSVTVVSLSYLIPELERELEYSQSEELSFSRKLFLHKATNIFNLLSKFRDKLSNER